MSPPTVAETREGGKAGVGYNAGSKHTSAGGAVLADGKLRGLMISGGKGSRMRPFTYTGAKQLIPIANKPILFYGIEWLVQAGVDEIGVVVGDTAAEVKAALGDGSRFGCRLQFCQQEAPLGIAHAVKTGRDVVGDDPFIVFLGDNFIRGGIRPFVEAFRASGADAQVLLTPVPNPRDFGVALLDERGRPVRLIEKPPEPPTDLALVGVYMFNKRFWEAVELVRPSARGELEITDTIQKLIDLGADVRAEVVRDNWIDTGKVTDLLTANRIVLDDLEAASDGASVDGSSISGKVVLQPGARVINSVVHGPAIIGEETEVVDSYVGPYTSVYHHCRLRETEIECSVVLENSTIEGLGKRIHESLIGRNVELRGDSRKPQAYRLTLGDFSKVQVP